MKKIVFFSLSVVVSSIFFSGCLPQRNSNTAAQSTNMESDTGVEKSGETQMSGVISQAGSSFFLQEAGKQPKQVDSYSVELGQYVGKTVTVKGQYSGDTLFIGEVISAK